MVLLPPQYLDKVFQFHWLALQHPPNDQFREKVRVRDDLKYIYIYI